MKGTGSFSEECSCCRNHCGCTWALRLRVSGLGSQIVQVTEKRLSPICSSWRYVLLSAVPDIKRSLQLLVETLTFWFWFWRWLTLLFSLRRWATSHIWLLCWMLKSLQADIFSTGLCCMFCVLTEGWISIKSVQLMGSAMLSAEWSPQTFACLNVLYRYNKDIHLGGGLAVPLEISPQIFMQISTTWCYLHLLTCCPPLLLLAITQTNTISKNLVSEHKHFQFYWYSCYAETFILWLNNSSCS